jgi:hypothetical protein
MKKVRFLENATYSHTSVEVKAGEFRDPIPAGIASGTSFMKGFICEFDDEAADFIVAQGHGEIVE